MGDNGFEGWKRRVSDLLAPSPLPKILRADLTPKAFEDAMNRGNFGNSDQMA